MFSATCNPLPPVSTLYDFGKHHHVQTGSTDNSETETDIDAISRAAMFWGIPSPAVLESTASDFRKQRHVRTSGLGYCFYFRFVSDAVLQSRILSACPMQPLKSPSYRFPSQNNNYFRYPSAILEFSDEGSVE